MAHLPADVTAAAQVALRWAVQRGTVALPKSVQAARVVENASIFDFELDAADMAAVAALDKDFHFLRPFDWCALVADAVRLTRGRYGIPLFGHC